MVDLADSVGRERCLIGNRDDILAHAYAQCRSNKGAPGVDGQEFADVEAYGVQRWLGELALALREETYRPEPIRRVFIPKANGKLQPLGISILRDRVCMTAAMLVLEPNYFQVGTVNKAYRALTPREDRDESLHQ
jgi:retron-type reverse transcriptase